MGHAQIRRKTARNRTEPDRQQSVIVQHRQHRNPLTIQFSMFDNIFHKIRVPRNLESQKRSRVLRIVTIFPFFIFSQHFPWSILIIELNSTWKNGLQIINRPFRFQLGQINYHPCLYGLGQPHFDRPRFLIWPASLI